MNADITIVISDDGTATLDGEALDSVPGMPVHQAALNAATARAKALNPDEPSIVKAETPDGVWWMRIHNGNVTQLRAPSGTGAVQVVETPVSPVPQSQADARQAQSFLSKPGTAENGARTWFGGARRAEREAASREEKRLVSQWWPGTRTVLVANGKGGSGKTPTTILTAAVLARNGGAGVVAVDGNVTRGTLGWRTEQAGHNGTIREILENLERLSAVSASAADISAYVHHQTDDMFDVLRSNPLLLSTQQKMHPSVFEELHKVLSRYYRLIIIDTGNDEGDELWLSMAGRSNQLVVPTTTRADHAEAARLLLSALHERGGHFADLARSAVVVVSQADKDERSARVVAEMFSSFSQVVTIPYDSAMRNQYLRFDLLNRRTQAAWNRAVSVIAGALS